MAIRLNNARGDELAEISEINLAPFIDVMLVLLIVFMIAAPLSTVDVAVDLPMSSASPEQRPSKPIYVTLRADLTVTLGDDALLSEELPRAIDLLSGRDRQQRIFVRADRTAPYGELMKLMNLLRDAGYLRIGLVALEDVQANGSPK